MATRLFFAGMYLLFAFACNGQLPVRGATETGNPCTDSAAIIKSAAGFTNTAVFGEALFQLTQKMAAQPQTEHVLAFGKDSNGGIIPSAIGTGQRSSGVVPQVPTAFADLHNHPKGGPPSSGDLYGLLQKGRRQAGYRTRYVMTPGGTLYALVMTDTAAAAAFLARYPPQLLAGYSPLFPDSLLTQFREIRYLHGAAEELAMAWVLEAYNTGVVLLKRDRDGLFIRLRTAVAEKDGQLRYVGNHCLL